MYNKARQQDANSNDTAANDRSSHKMLESNAGKSRTVASIMWLGLASLESRVAGNSSTLTVSTVSVSRTWWKQSVGSESNLNDRLVI